MTGYKYSVFYLSLPDYLPIKEKEKVPKLNLTSVWNWSLTIMTPAFDTGVWNVVYLEKYLRRLHSIRALTV